MPLVIDASYTLALALAEGDPPGAAEVSARIASGEAIVPPIWRFEVANALLTATRRRRIEATAPGLILADLALLPIGEDPDAPARAWTASYALALHHGLSAYDASYLELAMRRQAILATLDLELAGAARREGIAVAGR